jgi:hypothetical protein
MELREQLHHLIEALPENTLEDAAKLLVALQQPATAKPPLQVADLGWTPQQAAETRARLASFEEDWDAPGMDGYDDL